VAIKKLKEIHTATHPGATLKASQPCDDAEYSSGEPPSCLAAGDSENLEKKPEP